MGVWLYTDGLHVIDFRLKFNVKGECFSHTDIIWFFLWPEEPAYFLFDQMIYEKEFLKKQWLVISRDPNDVLYGYRVGNNSVLKGP